VTPAATLRDNVELVKTGLPIDSILPALRAALVQSTCVVLQAPPGAGKSTVVPLALLDAPWVRERRIIMLEPRRLAARAVAARMAQTLGEQIGRTVGYRMRLDTRVTAATRIEVVTEGVLTRMLQADPALDGVAAVLFDEFHERNLAADLGLALALDAQANLSPELRVLVMSATLDGARIAELLEGAPIVTAEGRAYPVDTIYTDNALPALPGDPDPPERIVLRAIKRALRETEGDVLVFLPGAGEIRRVEELLCAGADPEGWQNIRVLPLFGELPPEAQDAALARAPAGTRKIVLATNIAETSLTIDGVTVVVDAGLERRALFDPATGMSRLETQRISRASADQRQGRAGRTAPGRCYRAWGEGAHRSLAAFTPAEIMAADLAPLALDLAAWGTEEGALRWLDPPPVATLASARDLLRALSALDATGKITAHGRAMSELATHPRLAHMLLVGKREGFAAEAAWLAALLTERDILRPSGRHEPWVTRDADLRTRIDALAGRAEGGATIDRGVRERVRRGAEALLRQLGAARQSLDETALRSLHREAGRLLALAYPDRIGMRRDGTEARYQLANGRGARFEDPASIAREEFIVAVDLDDHDRDARIRLAVPLSRTVLLEEFAAEIERREEVRWDSREQAVVARRIAVLAGLVLEERALPNASQDATATAMLAGIRELGLAALPWDDDARSLQARIMFVRSLPRTDVADWPDVSDATLASNLEWLAPFVDGVSRRAHLQRVPLGDALRAQLSYAQQIALDELAPTHLALPTGTRARIDYRDDNAPCASMRMQEVFGLAATPRIGGGTVPVTFKLLSPAQRPLQITRDLASFWRNAYIEVRKDMRGRYPRHYWPEDPLQAEPTKRTKPRG
jgi:ATP-dependent helicase HrpB